jgi:Tfp pilus assembly protein PilV
MFEFFAKFKKNFNKQTGQSLVEILVALAVGIIFVLGVMIVMQSSLKMGKDSEKIQTSASLARELMDNVKVFSDSDWHNIYNLATTSANHYYLNTTSSPFTVSSGDETVVVGTTTYIRYFYVDDVYRDGSGKISDSGTFDPSTKKITVGVRWTNSNDRFISTYLTRSKNNIFVQTDWTGGGGQTGPITSTNNQFDTSTSNIDFSTTTGSIRLKLGY